jgi:DNA-binding beta-propeller fold protein YncE
MNQHNYLILLCFTFLVGCGGGSGGSASPPPSPPPAPPPSPPPSPAEPGSVGATIAFPWQVSTATASSVIVRGRASDPQGVATVRVNGSQATVSAPASAGIAPGAVLVNQASGRFASTLSEHESEHEAAVEWEVEIELVPGENELIVEVENESGEVTEEAASARIRYDEVPAVFALDTDRTRVVGQSFTLTQTGYRSRLVEHDYGSGVQTVHGEVIGAPTLTCLRGHQNEFLRLVMPAQDEWELHRHVLGTPQATILATIPPAVRDPGPGYQPAPFLRRLVCSENHDHAYALANYFPEGGGDFSLSRIWRIALATAQVDVLAETAAVGSPDWLAIDITLAGDQLVSLRDLNPTEPLMSVALADGEHSVLTPGLNVGGLALAAVPDQNLVYVATFGGIDRVELGPSPTKANISPVPASNPYVFEQVRSIAHDVVHGRLIVGDDGLDALIAVDEITGERSDFLSRRIGSGAPVIAPRRLALTSDATKAYVADDGLNATERFFEVDLATGDRREIGDINQALNFSINGLALDEDGGRAWVSSRNSVVEVDLETEAVRAIARPAPAQTNSLFQSMSSVTFDAQRNRLLVGDLSLQAIIAIDLDSELQSIFSQEGVRGDGEAFATITSMSIDDEAGVAYVSNQLNNSILVVDLETGDREPFATSCPIEQPAERLKQALHDPIRSELLILGDTLFVHDLASGGCIQISLRTGLDNVQVTPEGQLLVTMLRAVAQLDRPSGQMVMISR